MAGKKFPDLNKDGKITQADILIGRGVTDKNNERRKKLSDAVKNKEKGK